MSIWPLVSRLDPIRRPIGLSLGKYLRAAASLITATFGARGGVLGLREAAASSRGMPIIAKNFGDDDEPVDALWLTRLIHASLNEKVRAVDVARQQRRLRQAGLAHAGDRANPIQHVPIEQRDPLLVVPVQLRVHAKEREILRVEADVDVTQILHRAKKQPGADQQHQRDRHLRHEQTFAERVSRADDCYGCSL